MLKRFQSLIHTKFIYIIVFIYFFRHFIIYFKKKRMGNVQEKLKSRPVVVIVGGGVGGTEVARLLESQFNVLLIDKKDHFFHKYAPLRAAVDSSFATNIAIPYSKLLKYGHVLQAEVTEVQENGFKIKGNDDLFHFDYLVLATGSTYSFPSKNVLHDHKLLPELFAESEKVIKEANNILIVGGGPIGVELVGEIAYHYPEKKVTIVSSRDHLIPGDSTVAFRERIYDIVKGFPNVNIVLGQRVVIEDEIQNSSETFYITGNRTISTNKGIEIETDLIFMCNGPKVDNFCFKNSFAHKVNEHGQIMVNKNLQVEGQEKIFACGDCANVPELKNGRFAGYQARVLARNIINHDSKDSLREYKPWRPFIRLTIGKDQGAVQLPTENGFILGSFAISMGFGKTLGTPRAWRIMNVKNIPDHKTDEFFTSKIDQERRERFSSVMKLNEIQASNLFGSESEKKL